MEIRYTNPKYLEPHPLNLELVPEMAPEEFEALVEDVREKGVLQPLEILKGTNLILDGRNRWKAAIEAELGEIPYLEVDIPEEEVPLYILERVPTHRSLPPGVRAALAAEWVEAMRPYIRRGRPEKGAKNCTFFSSSDPEPEHIEKNPQKIADFSVGRAGLRKAAATRFGVNHQYVQIALNLKKYAPESFELLKRGEISLKEAQGILTRARIEAEAADRLIPELLELIDHADLDPAVVWEICFMSPEGQKWLVETIQRAGLDVAESLVEMKAREMRHVRLTVEEIINHPAVQDELRKKEEKIAELQRKIEDYERKQREIENKYASLQEERERLLARIRELEEQPTVSDTETEEYFELRERLEEMERRMEELELERDRMEADAYSAQQAYEAVFKRYKELEARVKEYEEVITRLRTAVRKKKKRKSWVDELKAQHRREIQKYQRKIEKLQADCDRLREGTVVLTKILTGREQVKKRKKLVRELYEIAGHLKAEDLHQSLFDAIVDPYTEKSSIFAAFEQVVEGLVALTETFSKACRTAMANFGKEGGNDETIDAKIVRIEEARAAAGGRDVSET